MLKEILRKDTEKVVALEKKVEQAKLELANLVLRTLYGLDKTVCEFEVIWPDFCDSRDMKEDIFLPLLRNAKKVHVMSCVKLCIVGGGILGKCEYQRLVVRKSVLSFINNSSTVSIVKDDLREAPIQTDLVKIMGDDPDLAKAIAKRRGIIAETWGYHGLEAVYAPTGCLWKRQCAVKIETKKSTTWKMVDCKQEIPLCLQLI